MASNAVPIVTTSLGRLQGVRRRGYDEYRGIPYAKPPVGLLRYAPPVPVDPWEGLRLATHLGSTPLRTGTSGLIPEPAVPGTDTLNLNVYSPWPANVPGSCNTRPLRADTSADSAAGLPVLVWIHGGGYTGGSIASPWYDGASFARSGIVTVVISYRLGFDGFGAIPGTPPNRAVRDWLCALEWVQAHIASFGGDPARVTIAGQSAGGGAVLTLLGMPAASHLFRAVWASSAVLPVHMLDSAEAGARRLAERLEIAPTRSGFASVAEERVIAEQGVAHPHYSTLSRFIDNAPPFSPVVDGDLVPEPTLQALTRGVGSQAELIIGSNDHELRLPKLVLPSWLHFVPSGLALMATGLHGDKLQDYRAAQHGPRAPETPAAVAERAEHETREAESNAQGTGSDAQSAEQAAVLDEPGRHMPVPRRARKMRNEVSTDRIDTVDLLEQEVTDRVFRRHVVRVAEARQKTGATTRVYRFSWISPAKGGAVHCLDVPFFWDVLGEKHVPALAGPYPPQWLANVMHGTAVAHIRGDEIDWPKWDETNRTVAWIGGGDLPVAALSHGYASLAQLL